MISRKSTLAWGTSLAAATAVVFGGIALAGDSGSGVNRVTADHQTRVEARVFTVVERATTDVVVYVNKKAQDDVIGNTLGFGNKLYTAGNNRQIGRSQGFCYRTNPGRSWECTWTNILPKGRITVQGVFPDSLSDSRLAITGGTGAYAKARGFMLLHSRNAAGTAFDFEFHVL